MNLLELISALVYKSVLVNNLLISPLVKAEGFSVFLIAFCALRLIFLPDVAKRNKNKEKISKNPYII